MITKTDFLIYDQHPCWLWLSKNQPDLLPPDDENLAQTFEDGNDLEAFAAQRFENVALGELSVVPGSVAMQCVFAWGNFECRSGLLIREPDGSIHLVEIKSSTRVKPEHLLDLAFQKQVLEANDQVMSRVSVMHVNNSYVRSGEIDPNQLLTMTDVTAEVSALSSEIATQMRTAESTALSVDMPDPSPRYCHKDFKKDWLRIARNLTKLPEGCVY
ncbi:hypothetical protein CCB80_02195 [Armatimonadetes bacterium Uphvl-Ar1]|nr:hypothetical protein CCB80_02195 [Armatimonadetes bacterium Uphvl-Ar1]